MTRQSIPALGLLWLALAVGPLARPVGAQGHDAAAPAGAAEGHGGAAAHGASTPNILEPNRVLGISTLVVFLVLLATLGKFAWKPLLKALHDREELLEHTLQETERARHEAERLLAEHRNQMAQAAEQVRALIDKAHRDAEATAADILRKAQEEAEESRKRAERDIFNARDQALMEIWSKTADLAVSVASRVLSKQLGDEDHRRLVEAAVQELPDRPSAVNGHGGQRA